MEAGATPIVFELGGARVEGLGPWREAVAPAREIAFSFPGRSLEPADAPLWRIDLPADPAEAEARLAAEEAALADGARALAQAAGTMDALAASGRPAAMPSFEAGPASPEAELLADLAGIERGRGPESFALGEAGGRWDEASRQLRAMLERLWRSVSRYAWVETRAGGELVGRTSVGWTGDTATALREEVEPGRADLHRRAVALAVASRSAWVRTVAVAAEGAVKLSVLLSVPGGAVLAIPVAWKYIRAVMDRLDAGLDGGATS